jgi:ABC-type phosphate transport system substrate-binding protein
MTALRKLLGLSRWSRAVLCLGMLATLITACSLLFDTGRDQCASDTDCNGFPNQPVCHAGLCVGVGPRGCFFGTPSTPDQFGNACTTATSVPFDNCQRLGLCSPGAQPPPAVTPVPPDAGSTGDAPPPPPPPTTECIDNTRQVVVIGGSTEIQPFMSVVAPLLSGIQIVYQPSGSCTGADQMFSPDPTKHVVKDIVGKPALLFSPDGKTSTPCTLATQNGMPPVTPVTLDVEASDVFASSCNSTYAVSDQGPIGEYFGPILPMTFVVKAESTQQSISAEMGHVVFGRGSTDPNSNPFTDPSLYFVRNSGSGTQQMISRAISVDAKQWWGIDRGGSTQVLSLMESVSATRAENAVGILSTDFTDPVRGQLRILAFQATGQLAGFYPDSSANTRDKRNVRDGHYAIWGPEHFFALTPGGIPNAAAGALVTLFTLSKLPQPLLDAIIKSGLVPACAMNVKRDTEMGPLAAYSPPSACGCYFEANVPGGAAPASCKPCNGPSDCPSDKPACNNGYCELH